MSPVCLEANLPIVKSVILLLPFLTVGCATTQEDFGAMSVSDRQRAVCYGSNAFKQRKEQLTVYETEIEKKQVVLSRGYRIHKQCQTVKIKAPPKDCSGYSTTLGKTACAGTAWTRDSYETQCTETPVSIDPRYERESLDESRNASAKLAALHSQRTQACLMRVASMPPQAAYIYYSENMEPQ